MNSRKTSNGVGSLLLLGLLSGCAQWSQSSGSPSQQSPLPETCSAYFDLKTQLLQSNHQNATKPSWNAGQCQASRSTSHVIYTCAWQLQSLGAAQTFWRYQYEQLAACFSGEWFHKVDGLKSSAYFRDDEKFSIELDRVVTQLDLNSNSETPFKKHQVHLSFKAYSPVLIGGEG